MQTLIARCKRLLPAVTSPVLLIQALNDDMTGPRNSEYIRDRVGSARREMVMLEHSYHVVSADVERTAVAGHLQRFCDSLAVARAHV
jgi:carboxylesterase